MDALINPIKDIWLTALTWSDEHIWNIDIGIQIAYITVAFLIATIIYRAYRMKIRTAIEGLNLQAIPQRLLKNLIKLIVPFIGLILIFLISQSAQPLLNIDLGLSSAAIKLSAAWIAIRICLQFINNSFIRNIASLSIWIVTALSIFGILDETYNVLDGAGFNMGEFRFSALAIIKGGLALFFLLYFASLIATFIEHRIDASKSLSRSLKVLSSKIVRISLITMAVIIGITSAGIDLSVFAIFSGAIGLGIGFGLQKVVSNLFSGILLLTDQSIKPGDVIELEESGTFGWVQNMAARYTEIVTRDNKSYLIPNEEFITQRVVNWSHGNSLVRIEIAFGVDYKSNPHQVIEIASIAAATVERVVSHPEPVCWITEFGDNSINFSLRFWIRDAESGVTNVQGQVFLALWDAFQEHNIAIPYPHREVYIHNVDDK